MKQKLITAFMVMCLLTVMLAMPVFASENTVSGSCGMYISWTLDLDTGVLELSGTGAMADYQYREDNPWRVHRYAITSIVVNEGITEIGQSAFIDCLKVTKVSLPDGITRIGKYAFNNAQALQEIVLPDTVTLIDESAFECCYGLQTVTFPKNLKTLGSRAFADTWLLNAQLPDGLESIGTYAFGSCDNLQKVTMTNSVTTLGENAFLACTNLVSARLSDNLTSLPGGTFTRCQSLKYINIPKSAKSLGKSCFDGCNSLTGILLPHGLQQTGSYCFAGTAIQKIVIPATVTTVGYRSFSDCRQLRQIAVCNPEAYVKHDRWDKNTLGVVGITTVYGYAESTAHLFAVEGGFRFQLLTADNLWTDTLPVMDNVTMTEAVGHATGNIVRWEAVEGAKLYQLFRRAASESSWTLVTNTGSTAYKDTSAAAGVKYYYKARARFYDFMGGLDIPAVSAIRPGSSALANVTITKTVGHSTGNILYWNAVSGAKLYQVYRLDNGAWTLLKNTGSLAYKDELAKVGVKTYYKVVARNGNNKSDIGSTTSASAVRQAPVSLSNVVMQSAQGHSTGIIVRWNAVGGASLYQVYRLKSGSSSWELLTNTGSTAYKDTTAVSGVRYYYKVVARYGNLKSSMNIDSVSAVRP